LTPRQAGAGAGISGNDRGSASGRMGFILTTSNLSKRFGGLSAVDNVDLSLSPGELRCIIGPNGCGKTTLFNLITGDLKPTQGRVVFDGQDITGWPVHRVSRLGIVRKFQVPSVFEGLTVFQNMRVPYWAGKRPALASRPRLMLLDEPTAGMTVPETEATARLIQRISAEHRVSIVVIEHDVAFVQAVASRVTVMFKGSIFREGTYREIQAAPEIHQIYLGRHQ
jgi:branched-chain amino acid transport system ATP-binding protein